MDRLSLPWIGIGAVIIIGLNLLWSNLLAEPLALPLMSSLGLIGGLIVFALIVAILSFFVGGIVIGRLSKGKTMPEAGIACLIAIAVNITINTIQSGQFPGFLGIAIVVLLGFGLGFAGAKIGDMWKERARGNQPMSGAAA